MTLKKSLFTSLAILSLAVPVTGGAIVTFSASPALAKGGKDKGGSDRGSRSDRGKRDKGSRGSSSRGRSGTGGGNGNGNAFGAGNGNGGGGGQPANVKPAKSVATVEPEVTEGPVEMHPSQLGSMNGAMNANINAVLAHIRNGNTNGPVGALAGLAVADHDAAKAEETLATAAKFDALDEALSGTEYETLEEYQAAVDAGEITTISEIEDALTALGDAEEPSDEQIADAESALEALPEAEAAIFEAWNKSGEASEEEKQALLDALRERLEAESETIADTIASGEETASDDDGDDDGEDSDDTEGETAEGESGDDGEDDGEGDGEDDDGEEDTAALDAETKAMIDGLKF